MDLPLRESRSVIIDAGGLGTLTLGPVPVSQIWRIERMTIMLTGWAAGNPLAQCVVYQGSAADDHLVDSTILGGMDVSELPNPIYLHESETLTFVWSAATVGAQATAVVQGRRQDRGFPG